ncbi:MAG: hypothetical protein NUV75_08745, partial [Gallionella sp.]|nr:hypothetical protein [Gallionella sp.]
SLTTNGCHPGKMIFACAQRRPHPTELEETAFWRSRVGEWRAICDVHDGELMVLILKIAPRGDVYK